MLSKKKCDSATFPCNNCVRLQLHCESGVGLVWEDDARREGMRRRGPPQLKKHQAVYASQLQRPVAAQDGRTSTADGCQQGRDGAAPVQTDQAPDLTRRIPSSVNSDLLPNEVVLLGRYVDLFSRTYPTCSGPTNPFVSVFLPLAMQSTVVLDSLLALSGAQTWNEWGFAMEKTTLNLRQRALAGCQNLLVRAQGAAMSNGQDQSWLEVMSEEDFLLLMASCILLLLYEKIVGEGKGNWLPHLEFMARVFANFIRQRTGYNTGPVLHQLRNPEAFQFIHNLFLYNDLVHSISRETSTLSGYYLRLEQEEAPTTLTEPPSWPNNISFFPAPIPATTTPHDSRHWFPHLIARISAGDVNVTDADITSWDGRVDWFPSFSLLTTPQSGSESSLTSNNMSNVTECVQNASNHQQPPLTERSQEPLISEIYRIAARVYRIHVFSRRGLISNDAQSAAVDTCALACHAVQLILQLPGSSPFENALLWPIGTIAKELTGEHMEERNAILDRLLALERRFQMRHFERARAVLQEMWQKKDAGGAREAGHVTNEVLLFG